MSTNMHIPHIYNNIVYNHYFIAIIVQRPLPCILKCQIFHTRKKWVSHHKKCDNAMLQVQGQQSYILNQGKRCLTKLC